MSPRFSVVTPVYNPPLDVLRETVDSVLAQTFGDFELILVDDKSPEQAVRDLLHSYAKRDARVRVIERSENGGIVAASNDGLAAASGDFIALLDHDDLLVPSALAQVAKVIDEYDDVDYIYSDETVINAKGEHVTFRKPDWSPERLRGQMYTCHLSVIRADVVRTVGGFRAGYDGSQDHDLILRVGEVARRVVHIPRVLYYWRGIEGSAAATGVEAKPYAVDAGVRAVQDHLDRVGVDASVEAVWNGDVYHYGLTYRPVKGQSVSVIMPTIGTTKLIWGEYRTLVVEAVRSVLAEAGDYDLEIVVVYDKPTPQRVLEQVQELAGERLKLVRFDEVFNYARKMNTGVLHSRGERLVFLNDDVATKEPGWLAQLLGPLEEPGVGMTGAKLYFADSTLQHVGQIFAKNGWSHAHVGDAGDSPGPFAAFFVNHEVSGVTGACVGMRREEFFDVGGFHEGFPNNYNDVDLCYKVRGAGHRIVWVATCELFHFESASRNNKVERHERRAMVARWGTPTRDPYFPWM